MFRLGRCRLWLISGQTTAEYAILSFWTVIVALGAIEGLRIAVLDYYYDLASFICLPIP
jgi:hypothetical protein